MEQGPNHFGLVRINGQTFLATIIDDPVAVAWIATGPLVRFETLHQSGLGALRECF